MNQEEKTKWNITKCLFLQTFGLMLDLNDVKQNLAHKILMVWEVDLSLLSESYLLSVYHNLFYLFLFLTVL